MHWMQHKNPTRNKVRFLKKNKWINKIIIFLPFWSEMVYIGGFSSFFQKPDIHRSWGVSRSFGASSCFFWAIKNCFWTIFKIVYHNGIWGGGSQKVIRHGKKVETFFRKKNILNQAAKRNKKMGGRSYVITFGAIGTL